MTVSRQEIARAAGVTPALVTYYFSDQTGLIREATRPLIAEAIGTLNGILESQESYQERLKRLISLFIAFAAQNSRILDAFISTTGHSDDAESSALIMTAYTKLTRFFADAGRDGVWREYDPSFFLFAVWGMCKFVAEPPVLPVRMFDRLPVEQVREAQAALIVDLLVRGISVPLPSAGEARVVP